MKNLLLTLFVALVSLGNIHAQENVRLVSALDTVYEENFDALGSTGIVDNLDGWYVSSGGLLGGILNSSDGTGLLDGGAFNFGSTGSTDRALGGRADDLSGNVEIVWMFKNTSGEPITKFDIYYKGEQWYGGLSHIGSQKLDFSFGVGTTAENVAYTDYIFDFYNLKGCNTLLGGCLSSKGALNGNATGNYAEGESSFTVVESVADGEYFALRWVLEGGFVFLNSHGMAIDDVGFVPYNDTATTWYPLGTNFASASNWTKYPNLKSSTAKPVASGKGFNDSNANFIIDRDLTYTGDFDLSGTSTKVIVKDGVNFTLGNGSSNDVKANIILLPGATFTSNLYNATSNLIDLQFDSIYDGSTVVFNNQNANVGSVNIPAANYYDIRITDTFKSKAFNTASAITVRNNFTYLPDFYPSKVSDLKVRFQGDVSFDMPNNSGVFLFSEFIISEGSTLTLNTIWPSVIHKNLLYLNADVTFESGSMLNLIADQTLIINSGSFTHNGILELQSDASLIINDPVTVTGTGITSITRNQTNGSSLVQDGGVTESGVSVNQVGAMNEVTNHWSSPVSTMTVGPTGDVSGNKRWIYLNGEDDNSDYVNLTSDVAIPRGRGCSAKGNTSTTFVANDPSELNFGTINYHADAEHDNDPDDAEYYLVGNPYASGLSAAQFLFTNAETNGDILGTIYLFSQVNEFGSYSKSADNIAVNLLGASDPGVLVDTAVTTGTYEGFSIASAQGFLVVDKTPEDDQIDLVYDPYMQLGINDDFKSLQDNVIGRFWVMLNDGKNYKTTLIGIADDATVGTDDRYDAPMLNAAEGLNVWTTIGDKNFEIQGLPPTDAKEFKVPLNIYANKAGSHDLKVVGKSAALHSEITLFDSELNISHDIGSGAYSFTAVKRGEIKDRFFLMVKASRNTVSVDDLNSTDKNCTAIATVDGGLKITKSLKELFVADITGKTLVDNSNVVVGKTIDISNSGAYIVRYTTDNEFTCAQKLWVN